MLPPPPETPVDRWVGWGFIPLPCAPARVSSHHWGARLISPLGGSHPWTTPGLFSFPVPPASHGGARLWPPAGMGGVSAVGACTDARGSTHPVCPRCPRIACTSRFLHSIGGWGLTAPWDLPLHGVPSSHWPCGGRSV